MNQFSIQAATTAEFIIGLYRQFGGNDYIGEPVSQIEHMCQCAHLAEEEGYDDEIILAAFFHDIGHLCEHIMEVGHMGGFGVMNHEQLGAAFLRENGFSEKISSLVGNHVEAKRYLTYRYPDYFDRLSPASRKTLEFQGGRMSPEEAAAFEADPYFVLHTRLRFWDDLAKRQNCPLPSLDRYQDMIVRHLNRAETDITPS